MFPKSLSSLKKGLVHFHPDPTAFVGLRVVEEPSNICLAIGDYGVCVYSS